MTTDQLDIAPVPRPTVFSTVEFSGDPVRVESFPPFGGLPPTVSLIAGGCEAAMFSTEQCRALAAILLAAARDADN